MEGGTHMYVNNCLTLPFPSPTKLLTLRGRNTYASFCVGNPLPPNLDILSF
jgi:hypothetical protein